MSAETIVPLLRDMQQIYQRRAIDLAGSPEADEALAHARRYGRAADEIEALRSEIDHLALVMSAYPE